MQASSSSSDDGLLRWVLIILAVAAIYIVATKPAVVSLEQFNTALDADGPAVVYFYSNF